MSNSPKCSEMLASRITGVCVGVVNGASTTVGQKRANGKECSTAGANLELQQLHILGKAAL